MSKFDELFGERIKQNAQNSSHVVKTETQDEVEIKKIDRVLVIGLLMLLLLVPLVIHVHFGDFVSPQVTGTDMDSGSKADIFTYYKYIILLIGTILLTIVFFYKVFFVGFKIPKSKINIFTGIFAISIVLSAIFASNKTLALFGMYNRHEGTLTYLCYITLFFIASNIKYSLKQLKAFIYILVPFILINTALGLISFFGIDILQYEWGKKILYSGLPEGSNIHEGSKLISTINHGNYVSGISAVFIAIFGSMTMMEKRIRLKVVNLLVTIISFVMLLTSFASSGFVTLLGLLPILIVAFFKVSNKKNFAISITSLLFLMMVVFIPMAKYESRVWDETIGFFAKSNPFAKQEVSYEPIKKNANNFSWFTDNRVFAQEPEFKFPELPEAGVAAGTGRAYIWEKSLEMIKEKPIFGYGLDTFVYNFNQNDPFKNSNLAEGYGVIVDKPHNMYINLAVGSGIVSIFSFLAILLFVLIDLMKQKHCKNTINSRIKLSISFGTLAFLIQFLFNDSVVGTAIFFWINLGLLNSYLSSQR